MKKIEDIKNMPTNELEAKLKTDQAAYTQMLLNHAVSPLADSSKIKASRRDIARIKTILRQRELNK
ncbi:MAG: 50S ribosomal protein L29 [Prevotellaceae bacterium]|nr:50S ribosomal protein L29 [Prevotellaceae bacterium]MDD7107377.1 50S ribosomal protein L29 [Prevotellaceae bacterium]MDY3296034.1 50S ribosomal protein L29 [Bacteroidaceae bacterium]